jgi:hypothetical protein
VGPPEKNNKMDFARTPPGKSTLRFYLFHLALPLLTSGIILWSIAASDLDHAVTSFFLTRPPNNSRGATTGFWKR